MKLGYVKFKRGINSDGMHIQTEEVGVSYNSELNECYLLLDNSTSMVIWAHTFDEKNDRQKSDWFEMTVNWKI